MKKNEKISFVIPMYNAEKYIEECINSIINQDYPNKEIIVVDDESTDESVKICNSKYNGIIKLITKNNFGVPAARNVGINEATGKYIMLIDSDDCLSSDNTIISRMIKKMQDENSDIIMGNMNVINEKSEFIKEKKLYFEEIKNEKLKRCLADPLPSNKIYNLDIIKNNKIFFDNVRIGQDLNFYLKYIYNCKKVSIIDDTVSYYRIVSNSISRTYTIKILDIVNSMACVEKYYHKVNASDIDFENLKIVKLQHYYSQLGKNIYFNILDRCFIIRYLKNEMSKIKLDNFNKDLSTEKFIKKIKFKAKIKCSLMFYVYMMLRRKFK